ncbi:MAG TPA: hypothetical protein GXZ48_02505 [Acholeplasmataceae bacterium]|jgi:hypothetical protein|nr:hypothetical protein [Acholeplasmataceae bacterium]
MTEKELLYVEDAINNARLVETKCNHWAQELTDPNLQNFARQVAERHRQIYTAVYQLLNS